MGLASVVRAARSLGRRIVNRVRRPAAVLTAQRRHLRKHPVCAACGSKRGAQAHHVRPFHAYPELGADPANFVTLCEGLGANDCHVRIGHGGAFRFYNPDTLAHVAAFARATSPEARAAILGMARSRRLPDTKESRSP